MNIEDTINEVIDRYWHKDDECYFEFRYDKNEVEFQIQTELNEYLSTWGSTPSFNEISGLIYSSDRDVLEKILRVKVEIVFANTIERIAIDIVIN